MKCFFFSESIKGVLSYLLIDNCMISIGNPVCKAEDMAFFINEYLAFCKKKRKKPIFNSISQQVALILKAYDYVVLKYGEEALLQLPEYTLAGGRRATLRRNVSKVEKSGVTLIEYCPNIARDDILEQEIEQLAQQWDYGYNFKNLYRFKKKFGPTVWKPRYLVYHHSISPIKLALSITKTRQGLENPKLYVKYVSFIIADFLGLHTRNDNK